MSEARVSTGPDQIAWANRVGVAVSLGAAALAVLALAAWPWGINWPSPSAESWPLVMPLWVALLLLGSASAAACLVRGFRIQALVLFALVTVLDALLAAGKVWYWEPGARLLQFPEQLQSDGFDLPSLPSQREVIIVACICVAGLLSCGSGRSRRRVRVLVSIFLALSLLIELSQIMASAYTLMHPEGGEWIQDEALTAIVGFAATGLGVAAARPTQLPMSLTPTPKALLVGLGLGVSVVAWDLFVAFLQMIAEDHGFAQAHEWATAIVITGLTIAVVAASVIVAHKSRLRGYTEAAAGAVLVVDARGRVVDANPQAASMLRSDVARLRGSAAEEWIPDRTREHHEGLEDQDFTAQGDRWLGDIRVTGHRADDTEFPADIALHAIAGPSGNVLLVSMRDRTEEEKLRSDRDRARQLLDQATEQSPIMLGVIEMDGTIAQLNDSACRFLGVDRADALGRPYRDFATWDDPEPDFLRMLGAAGARGLMEATHRFSRADGSTVWLELHVSALTDEAGRIVAISVQGIDVSAQMRAEAEVELTMAELDFRSRHDSLTELLDRRELLNEVGEFLATVDGHHVAVLYCDLDDFKYVNDGISHGAGDEVLLQVAKRLRTAASDGAIVGRMGGDEFVIGVRDVASPQAAKRLAAKVQDLVGAEPYQVDGHKLRIGVSIGISISRPGLDANTMLREADEALRRAKATGRGRCEIFGRAMRENSLRRVRIEEELRTALDEGRIHAAYQPIVDLDDYSLVGYEALARWHQPDGSVIPATEWIDVAEETGLTVAVGDRVAWEAARRLSDIPSDLFIAVNGSAAQLTSRFFAQSIVSMLHGYGARPEQMILEVTEQSIMQAPALVKATLDSLVDSGVRVCLDDFGTGYSSLTHLRTMPVYGIKLDKSFVDFSTDCSEEDGPSARVAMGLAELAGRLGLTTTAEGIEQECQADLLRRFGWQHGQGWLFGAAEPDPASQQV
ncbi:MAG: EAL domain-containing protein [Candidatus Nanopelagicales bacterium]|nr:EAL domain-containing protein [Candidatus Nanopelagicales bacterium]MDZ4250785.1 EAL domain-containing protein [Candidatus Nanopelagicales bacterium]